jgi:hypothetical protein
MGTRSVYAPLTIPYVIPIRDRPIGRIRHWKEDFENDKEGNQADSDDCNNRPFDSRHHAPLLTSRRDVNLLASPL